MQCQMHCDDAFYWYGPSTTLWGKHPCCAYTDSIHLEGPYAQLRLLAIFKYEASFLKPVVSLLILHKYMHAQELGLATDI